MVAWQAMHPTTNGVFLIGNSVVAPPGRGLLYVRRPALLAG